MFRTVYLCYIFKSVSCPCVHFSRIDYVKNVTPTKISPEKYWCGYIFKHKSHKYRHIQIRTSYLPYKCLFHARIKAVSRSAETQSRLGHSTNRVNTKKVLCLGVTFYNVTFSLPLNSWG